MPNPSTTASPRRRTLIAGGITVGLLCLGATGTAVATNLVDQDELPPNQSKRESSYPEDQPAAEPASASKARDVTEEFYEKYVPAKNDKPGDVEKLREEYLSAHYLKHDPNDSGGISGQDNVLASENKPVAIGEVEHDKRIADHHWIFVELKWKDGKVPSEERDEPGEEEPSPTKLRVQVDRESHKISDVARVEEKPAPEEL